MKQELIKAATVAGALVASTTSRGDAQVILDVEVGVLSSYSWRGVTLADAVAVQPTVRLRIGASGLALDVWGSAAIQDRDDHESSDELDFTVSYAGELGEAVSFSLGYIQYTFPHARKGARHSEEVYAAIGLDHALAPNIFAAYDFGLTDGLYVSAGIAPEIPLGDSLALVLGALAAVSDYADFGFHHAQLSAALGISTGSLTFAPVVGFTHAPDEIYPENSEFWAGIAVGFAVH